MTELPLCVCASPGESAPSDARRRVERTWGFSEWKREESKPGLRLYMSLQTLPAPSYSQFLNLDKLSRHYTGSKTQIY